jgi:phosphoglycolate phosphatase
VERLVLWDVDQTLMTAAGTGAGLFAAALKKLTGRDLERMPSLAGRTDRELVAAVLTGHGIAVDEALYEPFFAELAAAALLRADEMRERGRALPGAAAALAALAAIPGVTQTLVTGNLVAVARQKLGLFGLDGLIDFEIGGYGSEAHDRAELVALSRSRAARKLGRDLPGSRVVVIGDTPFDISGALRSGVRAIGVASGHSTARQLRDAGAHVVLDSLADTDAVVRAVLDPAG